MVRELTGTYAVRTNNYILILTLLLLSQCTQNIKSNYLVRISKNNIVSVIPKSQIEEIQTKHKETFTNPKSKYEAIKNFFLTAEEPTADLFHTEQALPGKCAYESDPQNLTEDFLKIYTESDPILGNFIYLAPQILGIPEKGQPRMLSSEPVDHRQIKRYFSSLQFHYPRDAPFYNVTIDRMGNAGYFSYENKDKKNSTLSTKIAFRVRVLKNEAESKQLFLLEQYCPYLNGCRFEDDSFRYNHLQAYSYCYYERNPAVPNTRLLRTLSSNMKVTPPREFRIEQEWDILGE